MAGRQASQPALALPSFPLSSPSPHPKYFNNGIHIDSDIPDLETVMPRQFTAWWLLKPPPPPWPTGSQWQQETTHWQGVCKYCPPALNSDGACVLRGTQEAGGWVEGASYQALSSSREGSEQQGSCNRPGTSWSSTMQVIAHGIQAPFLGPLMKSLWGCDFYFYIFTALHLGKTDATGNPQKTCSVLLQ